MQPAETCSKKNNDLLAFVTHTVCTLYLRLHYLILKGVVLSPKSLSSADMVYQMT